MNSSYGGGAGVMAQNIFLVHMTVSTILFHWPLDLRLNRIKDLESSIYSVLL